MNISVRIRTYDTYGGHATLSLVGGYLMLDAPTFGDALANVEVLMHFRSDGPPRRTLESTYEQFHAGLDCLPTTTFDRRKRAADVQFSSNLLTAIGAVRDRQLSLELFQKGCREVVEHLNLLRGRFRKDDVFDAAAFQAWLAQRLEQLPQSIDELTSLQSTIEARRIAAREAMTEWERAGIDFADFHPDARSVLPTPDCGTFATNGRPTAMIPARTCSPCTGNGGSAAAIATPVQRPFSTS